MIISIDMRTFGFALTGIASTFFDLILIFISEKEYFYRNLTFFPPNNMQ